MPDFNPFDMDFNGHVDGIDFLGFDYLMRHAVQPEEDEEYRDPWNASYTDDEPLDGWDHDAETEEDCESWVDYAWDAYDPPRAAVRPTPVQPHGEYKETHPSSGQEEDFADTYGERVQQWKERVNATYLLPEKEGSRHTRSGIAGRQLDASRGIAMMPPEPPPDEWLRDEFNQSFGSSVDGNDKAKQ